MIFKKSFYTGCDHSIGSNWDQRICRKMSTGCLHARALISRDTAADTRISAVRWLSANLPRCQLLLISWPHSALLLALSNDTWCWTQGITIYYYYYYSTSCFGHWLWLVIRRLMLIEVLISNRAPHCSTLVSWRNHVRSLNMITCHTASNPKLLWPTAQSKFVEFGRWAISLNLHLSAIYWWSRWFGILSIFQLLILPWICTHSRKN